MQRMVLRGLFVLLFFSTPIVQGLTITNILVERAFINPIITFNDFSVNLSFGSFYLCSTPDGSGYICPTSTNTTSAFSYSADNPLIATINEDNLLSISGAGETTITVTQAANDNYSEISQTATITVIDDNYCNGNGLLIFGFMSSTCECYGPFYGAQCQNIIILGGGDPDEA